jgi:integrase
MPRAAPYLVWDTYQRGLVVQVRPTGHRSWYCVYSFNGRPRWFHIADVSAVGLAKARELAADVMYEVAKGKDPAAERRASRTAGTFEDLVKLYEPHSQKKNKSWKQPDALVRKHLLPSWGKLMASDISRSDVKAMMVRVKAPIVANQTLAAAGAIFTWAIREEIGGVKVNPCVGVERNPTRTRERVLSDIEIPMFWKEFDEVDPIHGLALRTILLTGQRPGEVCHMRTEHLKKVVDATNLLPRYGWWEMPGEVIEDIWPGTKNKKSHRVALPVAVNDIIDRLEPEGFVFAAPMGGAIGSLAATMAAICKDLGVDRATPHDLRRTHGTLITSLGFGRDAMNRIQNHVESGVADIYDQHGYAEEDARIMAAVTSKILGLVSPGPGNVFPLVKPLKELKK